MTAATMGTRKCYSYIAEICMSKAFQFKKKKKAKDLLGLQFYGETNQTL